MIMVKAGAPVDAVIDELVPLLEPGDILIDGGNSHYPRHHPPHPSLKEKGMLFVGTGVSGGEEGALKGPSIMPGGNPDAWPAVKPIFQAIAAKVDGRHALLRLGRPRRRRPLRQDGPQRHRIRRHAAHLRSLLAHERSCSAWTPHALHEVFARWNAAPLDSYLIEITRDIFGFTDPETGKPMVDLILDNAGQKGTGKWTVTSALDLGVPLTLIGEAVFARCLSAQKDERVAAAKVLKGPTPAVRAATPRALVDDIEMALYASKIISYAQGYALMNAMAKESGWEINNGGVALMWRGGCIIRSAFLGKIKEAFDRDPDLANLLLDPFFTGEIDRGPGRLAAGRRRRRRPRASPLPAMTSALAYFDGYRSASLPANLLQAQRDYFGAHTYERIDQPRGEFFHTNWTGRGGTTASHHLQRLTVRTVAEDLGDHVAVHVGQPAVDAVVADGQPLVVDAEQVQDRGVEVVAERLPFRRRCQDQGSLWPWATPPWTPAPASQATDVPPLWSRPGRPLGERHPAELGAPDDQGVVEQAAGLQVAQQAGDRLIDGAGDRGKLGDDVGVVVPVVRRPARAAPDLDEPDAALQQPAGEQAAAAEVGGGRVVQAVEPAGGGLSLGKVERLGGAELHPGGQLVRGDPRLQPRIARVRLGVAAVLRASKARPSRSASGVRPDRPVRPGTGRGPADFAPASRIVP